MSPPSRFQSPETVEAAASQAPQGNIFNCNSTQAGADRLHRIIAGAGQRVDFILRPSNFAATVNGLFSRIEGCGAPGFCQATGEVMAGTTATVSWFNSADEPLELSLFVADRARPTSNGVYQLETVFTAEGCSPTGGPFTIAEDTEFTHEVFVGNRPDVSLTAPPCANPMGGADRVFQVALVVDAGMSATLTSAVPVTLNLLPNTQAACSGGLCAKGVASSPLPDGGHRALVEFTPSVTAEGLLVVSATGAPQSSAAYQLSVRFDAGVPFGETCGRAEPLTLPAFKPSETLVGFRKNYTLTSAVNCSASLGAERVYTVVAPAERQLVVQVNSAEDAVVNVVPYPAWNCASYCDTAVNMTPTGTETAYVGNRGLRPKPYYILVSRATPGPMSYSLSVTSD